jgi:hypothetical protein
MKIFAVIAALVLAPLAAGAQTVAAQNGGTAQKVAQTYHINFQNGEAEAGR